MFFIGQYSHGCYQIGGYNEYGHAKIVDAHDKRVCTRPCDMIRPHPNQEIPINVYVVTGDKLVPQVVKRKRRKKKKDEMSDESDNQNCRSRFIAIEKNKLNQGNIITNTVNVDCSKCNECIRIRKCEETLSFTQVQTSIYQKKNTYIPNIYS